MSYERKSLQILSSQGVTLLPPGDKAGAQQLLLGQNFRVDREGALVSRAGYVAATDSVFASVNYLHSAAVFAGDIYWGGNTGTATPGVLFFRTTAIWTGFSGGHLGLVAMNGFMWVMDPLWQIRHNATVGVLPWNITPPTTACIATPDVADPSGPNGTYQIWVTFASSDDSIESNPGPPSAPVVALNQDIALAGIPTSLDPTVGLRHIYASGGTLGQTYQIGTLSDNTTTTFEYNISDAVATNAGVVMPTENDPPPPGAGMVGPYFGRLISWVGNRIFWTDPWIPQYWPGSHDPVVGNWVDVGADGENIVWCTTHANVIVIYKDRSVWRKVGDMEDLIVGAIEQIDGAPGLMNPWGVCTGDSGDFYIGPNGLYENNLDNVTDVSGAILPIFNKALTNAGALTPPGRILPVGTYGLPGFSFYDASLGYAMGKLYISYRENGAATNPALFVGNGKRWMYHRNAAFNGRVYGFLFAGVAHWALGGDGTQGLVYNLDDFSLNYTADNGNLAIECVYQSHFEDAGLPDDPKVWMEVAVEIELQGSDVATVYAAYNNGKIALASLGTISGAGRQTVSFTLAQEAKNVSIALDCSAFGLVTIHNVYLYYYREARQAVNATTLPLELGQGHVLQTKELLLDINTVNGPCTATVWTDLPGNVLTLRQTLAIPQTGGRGLRKIPFSTIEGFIYWLGITANSGPFRLYAAKLLGRPIGVYVEGYEGAAGFIYDSLEHSFESLLTRIPRVYAIALSAQPIKRFREISVEIDTFGGDVTLQFLTDLPGDAQAVRYTTSFNTGTATRRFVRLVLPAGIEGRFCRIKLSGGAKFILYDLSVELLAVGVYIEAYEAAGGAVYDSREFDFGSQKPKEGRELEIDCETTGTIAVTLYSDLPSFTMQPVFQSSITTTGRQKIKLPLQQTLARFSQYPVGRMFRLVLSGAAAFRLYEANLKVRELGVYLTGDEVTGGGVWDSTAVDLPGTINVFKRLQLDIQTDTSFGTKAHVVILTDHSGTVQVQYETDIDTLSIRENVRVPLPQGLDGSLLQLQISGIGVRIFGAQVYCRELNNQQANWQWIPLPVEPTKPQPTSVSFLVNTTPPGSATQDPSQWIWGKIMSVTPTPDEFTMIDVPFQVLE